MLILYSIVNLTPELLFDAVLFATKRISPLAFKQFSRSTVSAAAYKVL